MAGCQAPGEVPVQTSKESRGTKREKERGGRDVEERKGGRKGAKEGRQLGSRRRKKKEREEETVREVERVQREELNVCLLSSGGLRCYPMKFSSMVSGQPHCPAEAPLGLMRDCGAWRLSITELSLF